MISRALAEGVDFKNVRHIHITEPFWNYARVAQVKARGIRMGSHLMLPKAKQNVQTYIYLSDYPATLPDTINPSIKKVLKDESKKREEPFDEADKVLFRKMITEIEYATDVDIYYKALKNYILIMDFMSLLAEASVDCAAHQKKFTKKIKNGSIGG